jgi:antitoxin PrlF
MSRYTGTITTTGKSEAIRLEKALFKSHPEFRQKTKVHAHVIGPGTMLVSVAGEAAAETEVDPVVAAFLSFLSGDILHAPERVKPLSATRIEEARNLTKGVEVRDDEALPDDVSL